MGDLRREPPNSIEAEQAVLGGVLIWPHRAGEVFDTVSSGDFYQPRHQAIADIMQLLIDGHAAFDVVIVAQALRTRGELDKIGGSPYLVELTKVPSAETLMPYYADMVAQLAKRRRIIRRCTQIIEVAYDGTKPVSEAERLFSDMGAEYGRWGRGVPV